MLLFYFCTLASGLFIYFCSILKELEFAIRQTHVHELNKNDMKLELTSYHESTNVLYYLHMASDDYEYLSHKQ